MNFLDKFINSLKQILGLNKSPMTPYFNLMRELRKHGKVLVNKRTGEKCYYKHGAHLEFDGSKGFLANTRRQIGKPDPNFNDRWRIDPAIGEGVGLIGLGLTSAKDLDQIALTKVWYMNANSTEAWLKNPWRKGEDDNGLIYQFKDIPDRCVAVGDAERDFYIAQGYSVEIEGKDGKFGMVRMIKQLDNLLHTLLTNPTDRRMIVTALHIGTFDKCSLPPCHHTYTFTYDSDNTLNIECAMRSWDVHLAFNIQITHWFLLTVCRMVGMNPGKVVLNATNAHLYGNALSAVDETISRTDFEAPTLVISDEVKQVTLDTYKGAFERLKTEYFWLEGYKSHPPIKTTMVK